MNDFINLFVQPRETMTWSKFIRTTPRNSIALDGVVSGGPRFDEDSMHINFDHHDHVVREATMSTAMQVYFAIKGGLMESFRSNNKPEANIYINDSDQDTALAVWLLNNYKLFEGVQSIPHVNRILELTNRWDITGGGFPTNLNEKLIRQHAWLFEPYNDLRKSGLLAAATPDILQNNLIAVMERLNILLMGQPDEKQLDTRYEILYESPNFKIVDEIGGSEARYYLFSKGMNAFISIVARREDGNMVCSVGRRSRFIPFPVPQLYEEFNKAEGLTSENGWNGSDIIGGSSRKHGTSLTWEKLRDLTNEVLGV